MQSGRRNKPALNCEECRRRKIKCDRNRPCSHCNLTRQTCMYRDRTPSSIVDHLPSPLQSHSERSYSTPIQRQHEKALGSEDMSSSLGSNAQAVLPAVSTVGPSAMSGDQNSTDIGTPETRLSNPAPSIFPRTPRPIRGLALHKGRLHNGTHWSSTSPEFKRCADATNTAQNRDDGSTQRIKVEVASLLLGCKELAKLLKTTRPTRTDHQPSTNPSILKAQADEVLSLYLSHFEPLFQICHEPALKMEYDEYWSSRAGMPLVNKCKVELVMAIGASLHPQFTSDSNLQDTARSWCYFAQFWIGGVFEKDRMTISGIQVKCLLLLARQCLAIGGDLIHISAGTLIRTAISIGLHRDPKCFPSIGGIEAHTRRCLWATVVEINLQAALDAGSPPNFSIDEFDAECAEFAKDSTENLDVNYRSTGTNVLRMVLYNTFPTRVEILQNLNGVHQTIQLTQLRKWTSELTGACRTMQVGNTGGQAPQFLLNLADMLIRRFLLALHRFWKVRNSSDTSAYFSRKISTDSAMMLLSPPSDATFSQLLMVGSGLFKHRLIHVSLSLAAELITEADEDGPSMYRNILLDAVKEARQQAVARIQHGDSNVRMALKLSVALACVDPSIGSDSMSQHMALAARNSLELSYTTLQDRAVRKGLMPSPVAANIYDGLETDSNLDLDFDQILQTCGISMQDQFRFTL